MIKPPDYGREAIQYHKPEHSRKVVVAAVKRLTEQSGWQAATDVLNEVQTAVETAFSQKSADATPPETSSE